MDYPTYLDELILEAASWQDGSENRLVHLDQIHRERFADCPPTWLTTAATELARMGYGIDWQDTSNLTFRITGGGILRASQIRKERATKTVIGRFKAISRSDWIAILALFVSAIALLKGD